MNNRCTLAQLRDMTPEQASALPIDQLALLLEEVGDLKADAKRLDEKLFSILNIKYAQPAAKKRQAAGKDTGTVSLTDGDHIIRADLPKAVTWDEAGLASAEAELVKMGEPPAEYVKVKRSVSETAFASWPTSLRKIFEPHRTVGVGKATYKVEKKEAA